MVVVSLGQVVEGLVRALLELRRAAAGVDRFPHVVSVQVRLRQKATPHSDRKKTTDAHICYMYKRAYKRACKRAYKRAYRSLK